jgi:hypothetical protein
MDKAYDLKDLGKKLEKRGISVAQEQLKGVLHDVGDWFVESAKLSSNPADDLAALGVPKLEELADSLIDAAAKKISS